MEDERVNGTLSDETIYELLSSKDVLSILRLSLSCW